MFVLNYYCVTFFTFHKNVCSDGANFTEENYSEIIFLLIQNNSTDAPVWLWSEGGPGITGLHSLFSHNGPYFLEEDKHIRLRNNSWHMTQNIVYLDSPVGVGKYQNKFEYV